MAEREYCTGCGSTLTIEELRERFPAAVSCCPERKMVPRVYSVKVRKEWSYVVGPTTPEHSGPWRYGWEAQEYADELNAQVAA